MPAHETHLLQRMVRHSTRQPTRATLWASLAKGERELIGALGAPALSAAVAKAARISRVLRPQERAPMNTNAEPSGSGATRTPALEPDRRVLRPV